MNIRLMHEEDWSAVKSIYQGGIDTGQATFESSPPATWQEWSQKFLPNLSLVYLADGKVVGWAAVSPVSSRQVYRGVGEVSLYVDPAHQGRGMGKKLLEGLIGVSEKAGFWTLQAGIFPENQGSVQLHLDCGFRDVGKRKRIGRMAYGPLAGKWRDVILLERRSERTGQEPLSMP